MKTMKSQYPQDPINCQTTEPLDYLSTYNSIRQISAENVKIIKANYKRLRRKKVDEPSVILGKAEEDGLGSFFYNQTFRLDNDD